MTPRTSSERPLESGSCAASTQMAENKRQPVDVIFGIDTTGSMADEIGFIQANMNMFSNKISDSGIDARVILISRPRDGMEVPLIEVPGVCIAAPLGSGSCPEDSNPPSYVHVFKPVADWDILQVYIDNYPTYKEYLRPDSFKTFVSVSDSDVDKPFLAPPISTPDTFVAAVEALEPGTQMWSNWRYSGIYAFSGCAPGSGEGKVHAELVKRTHGVGGDLCLQDFAPVFEALAKQVDEVVTLACDWEIPPPPAGETFSLDSTNVQLTLGDSTEQLPRASDTEACGSHDAWYYNDPADPKRVVACPDTCKRIQAQRDAKVELLFGCATVLLI